jgi:hypothetical protein
MQNTSNTDGVCKFIYKVHFCPQYFFAIKWSVLWSLQKIILILNFIFLVLDLVLSFWSLKIGFTRLLGFLSWNDFLKGKNQPLQFSAT